LAVSKINHDMRNILTSAQLMSDRLSMVDDPLVKRFAPKLCAPSTGLWLFERGAGLWQGPRSQAQAPLHQSLAALAREVHDIVAEEPRPASLRARGDVPISKIEADSDQMFRVIYNLVRNAVQAFASDPSDDAALVRRITLSAQAHRLGGGDPGGDTGPGLPAGRGRTCSSRSRARRDPAAPAWGWRSPGNWCWPMAARSRLTTPLRGARVPDRTARSAGAARHLPGPRLMIRQMHAAFRRMTATTARSRLSGLGKPRACSSPLCATNLRATAKFA
jgi:hypothetical protein